MKVLIGIQARSGSTRLPRKAFELISGRTMLDRVIDSCKTAASIVEKRRGHKTTVAVLTPEGDPIAAEFKARVNVEQGPEHDVLERYRMAVEKHQPDLLVRITGDCPLIPPHLIAHLTGIAIDKEYDYFSNVDDRVRTSIDGADCEVISRKLFAYGVECAKEQHDREHVTTFLRRVPPIWARMGAAVNHYDLSGIKLSVDTPEDLERVRSHFETQFQKYNDAVRIYGNGAIHRL